ncbi:SUKH-4 family immunity protein [Actinoplanes aureus]|uniref:SUKH-4 family immunity protein n=1 Tax=Actinoplanes aureus TaxID=2792083 RepID=A0A931CEX8_9ACTN|nr:SUKH-4 family immunity protein [Actinoplanes aureus]MBG0568640.1 SUKH-4 family immunity protein [Actinoplanes aureus]
MARWSDGGVVEPLDDATVGDWRVNCETRNLLVDVGLPAYGSLFVRSPQSSVEPLFPPYYILGREAVDWHRHELPFDLTCGCGYFGLSANDGSVWQLFPDHDDLPVNSNLALFYYFLNKVCGAMPSQNSDLPERTAVRRAEAVMRRLVNRDPILTSGADSFWGYIFKRPWS